MVLLEASVIVGRFLRSFWKRNSCSARLSLFLTGIRGAGIGSGGAVRGP
jgi:hypothetical protein